jgi:hypothetical protein
VGNVGPCLAICNGGGKDGFSPLDVTPAPYLDVTPSCHIKEWKCVRMDAPMTVEFLFFLKTKLNYLRKKIKKLHYKLVPQLTNSKEK